MLVGGADQYAFQNLHVLFGRNAVESAVFSFVPTAAERHAITLSVIHLYSVNLGVDEIGIGILDFQILACGRENEVRHTGLNAFGGAVDKEKLISLLNILHLRGVAGLCVRLLVGVSDREDIVQFIVRGDVEAVKEELALLVGQQETYGSL